MIFTAAMVGGIAIVGGRKWVVGAAIALTLIAQPVLAFIGLGIVGAFVAYRRRPTSADAGGDEATLADLTVLGLSAGLTFPAAAEAAAQAAPGDDADALVRALRLRDSPGGAGADDPALMVVAQRALSTGAPLIPAVAGLAAKLRDEERVRRLTAARRLPVKMLFPLALLILPGFLILTIGPAVLGSLERLGL